MAAVAAKKTAAKKTAPTLPEPVELVLTLSRKTPGTYVFTEEAADDGTVVIGTQYLKKWYMEQNGFVPDENTVVTVTIQVDQLDPE